MSEVAWAEQPMDRFGFVRRAIVQGLGLGFLAGGLEATVIAARVQLALGFDDGILLSTVSVLCGGAMGALLGGVIGLLFSIRGGRPDQWTRGLSRSAGGVAGCLGAWHLWPAGWTVAVVRGQPVAAIAFALAPLGFAGVVSLNARFGLKRAARGQPMRPNWVVASVLGSALLVLIAGMSMGGRGYGTDRALESDPSVVLITIDTLRRDHVSIYGANIVQTPVLDGLASEGIIFDNAVTPMPETAPAHAAMLTGRHPVRLGMLSNGHKLKRGVRTVAQELGEEGFATAAFVSSFALDSRTGLDRGFEAYDDDFFPYIRGLAEVQLAQWAIRLVMRFGDPMQIRSLLERSAEHTFAGALGWVRGLEKRPYFLWVHIFEPHSPYAAHGMSDDQAVDHSLILADEPGFEYTPKIIAQLRAQYAAEVAHTDSVLGVFLEQLRGIDDRPLTIMVAGDHGEMLGEHEIMFNHHGVWDEAVRVPLFIRLPDGRFAGHRVAAQVRLMDVANTLLASVRMDHIEDTESANLIRHAEGSLDRDLGTLLMGRVSASLQKGTVLGYRASLGGGAPVGQNLKYIWYPDTDAKALFDLSTDPGEAIDLSDKQAAAAEHLYQQVRGEAGTLLVETPKTDLAPGDRESLRALGYVE